MPALHGSLEMSHFMLPSVDDDDTTLLHATT